MPTEGSGDGIGAAVVGFGVGGRVGGGVGWRVGGTVGRLVGGDVEGGTGERVGSTGLEAGAEGEEFESQQSNEIPSSPGQQLPANPLH